MLRKVAFSTFLLATSLYILFPTPDEIVIFPTVAFFLYYAFHVPFIFGFLLAAVVYHSVGVAALIGSLLIGGKPIYYNLKEKCKRIRPLRVG